MLPFGKTPTDREARPLFASHTLAPQGSRPYAPDVLLAWRRVIVAYRNRRDNNHLGIMIEAALEEGYLHDEMDDSPDRKELYRNFTQDGPCRYLVDFMKSKKGIAPDGWDGWHPLLSK